MHDPVDAADVTQEIFIRVFRGIGRFNGASSLKTWIYRIALHEVSNYRRWWFRHKAREISAEPAPNATLAPSSLGEFVDAGPSPFDIMYRQEVRGRIREELRKVREPYRTAVVLRDLEEMPYEKVAEVTGTSIGAAKTRLTRGRKALKERLAPFLQATSLSESATVAGRNVEVAP